MEKSIAPGSQKGKLDFGRMSRVGLLTAVLAVGANSLIFVIADAVNALPSSVLIQPANQPISIAPVIFVTLIGLIGAVILLALLGRFSKQPIRLFRIISFVVLGLSLISPFSISGAPASMVIALLLMHLAAGIIIIGLLSTLPQRSI